eukprot:2233582-Pyramimonas_sp.AAC.1
MSCRVPMCPVLIRQRSVCPRGPLLVRRGRGQTSANSCCHVVSKREQICFSRATLFPDGGERRRRGHACLFVASHVARA